MFNLFRASISRSIGIVVVAFLFATTAHAGPGTEFLETLTRLSTADASIALDENLQRLAFEIQYGVPGRSRSYRQSIENGSVYRKYELLEAIGPGETAFQKAAKLEQTEIISGMSSHLLYRVGAQKQLSGNGFADFADFRNWLKMWGLTAEQVRGLEANWDPLFMVILENPNYAVQLKTEDWNFSHLLKSMIQSPKIGRFEDVTIVARPQSLTTAATPLLTSILQGILETSGSQNAAYFFRFFTVTDTSWITDDVLKALRDKDVKGAASLAFSDFVTWGFPSINVKDDRPTYGLGGSVIFGQIFVNLFQTIHGRELNTEESIVLLKIAGETLLQSRKYMDYYTSEALIRAVNSSVLIALMSDLDRKNLDLYVLVKELKKNLEKHHDAKRFGSILEFLSAYMNQMKGWKCWLANIGFVIR